MSLFNPTAYSLLLALSGRVPAGTTPGLDRLLAEQDPDGTIRGVAVFGAVPTAEQVRGLERLGLAVQPMQYVALADVAGPVRAMQAAVVEGIAADVYLDERPQDRKPVRSAHRFTQNADRVTRTESPRDSVVVSMFR
jgi:hypothetical protein